MKSGFFVVIQQWNSCCELLRKVRAKFCVKLFLLVLNFALETRTVLFFNALLINVTI